MKSYFNLSELIDAVIISLKHEFKNTKVIINNDCSKDLVLNSYPGSYMQIITNLIMNSLKHGFKDVEFGIITISATKDEKTLRISYNDDGVGIPKENLKKSLNHFLRRIELLVIVG